MLATNIGVLDDIYFIILVSLVSVCCENVFISSLSTSCRISFSEVFGLAYCAYSAYMLPRFYVPCITHFSLFRNNFYLLEG